MYKSDIAEELEVKIKKEMDTFIKNTNMDNSLDDLSYDELMNLKQEYLQRAEEQSYAKDKANVKVKRLELKNQNGSVNILTLSLIVIFILGICVGISMMIYKGV